MSINANNVAMISNRKPQPLLEAATYPARLMAVYDLGLQPDFFNGEEKAPKRNIMWVYEFLDEFMKDDDGQDITDKPRVLSESFKLFNLKADKAISTDRYLALDPTQKFKGEYKPLLGTPCMITVVHNPGKGKNAGRTFEKVAGIAGMREKDAKNAPALVNAPKYFDLTSPDLELFNTIPEWVRNIIKSNLEFNGSELQKLLGDKVEPPKQEVKKAVDGDGVETPF